ncbi:hypothetical protein ACBR40_28485 [Nonomuraea sp. AD125B]|uniref:hypothetical protein n=1 Tax=Nonomuraea sp. AD125B TaxID=3242897 RepID=UPI003529AA38
MHFFTTWRRSGDSPTKTSRSSINGFELCDSSDGQKWGLWLAGDNLAGALMWDGVRCVISVFVVHARETAPALDFRTDQMAPRQVKVYELEDEDDLLPGRRVTEYDLIFDGVPERLPGYLEVCLGRACEVGVVAWLGFEGSFHFSELLTPDIASSIYGVCASGSPVELALEAEERAGERWREVLQRHADALAT